MSKTSIEAGEVDENAMEKFVEKQEELGDILEGSTVREKAISLLEQACLS